MEASLAIAAGSDTTATALANAMFHLITDSDLLLRLRRELDAALHGEDDDIDSAVLADKPLLNAVIKETLRLYPAVPNGVQRTPAEDGGSVLVAGQ
jgi:cytochrome P450